mgnify:CR=1 FL=1
MSKFIKQLKWRNKWSYINIKIRNTAENSEKLKAELKKVLTEKDEEIVKPSIPGGIINAIPQIEASDKVINLGEKFEPLKGVTATDKEDGNITENIKIIENTVNVNAVGTYKVTYKVTDSKGAEARKTITVIVNALPVINAEDKVIKVGEDFNPLIGVTATDKEDGDITNKVMVIYNNVDTSIEGNYHVTYEIIDSNGNKVNKAMMVVVESEDKMSGENKPPIINANDITLEKGRYFDPLDGVTALDDEDGNLTNKIIVKENEVNVSKKGVYKVTYEVTDR